MKINRIVLFLIIYITHGCSFAQEVMSPLEYNPVIHQHISKYGMHSMKMNVVADSLVLPFQDDFSEAGIYPSAERWIDNKVFINSDLARNMPTVGVASFDGLDEHGDPYVPGAAISGSADVLTSKPIYLQTNGMAVYTISDSIYISFYYEKKGYGDAPDAADSLVLEFNHPALGWTRQWFIKGGVTAGQDTFFTRVDILITDPVFLFDGFQFRFRSFGNVSGNLDHWHLDYVRLFSKTITGYADIHDVAFLKNRSRYLNTYTSVPWEHYKNTSPAALLPDSTTLNFINYNDLPRDIGFNHRSYDNSGGLLGSFGAPLGNIFGPFDPNLAYLYTYPMGYQYSTTPELSPDSNYFDFKDFFSNLGSSNNAIRSNDTIEYRQYFYNYYSYDDGTCEVAYDLINAPNGKVAMKFDILQGDILRGVQMFFAQQNTVVSNKLMTIKIWSSLSPETVIYQQTNMTPRYIDSLNGFAVYVFSSQVNVPTTFYVGFQQIAADGLHLGFDKNTINNPRMYSNISGTWSLVSAAQGTFMMRPFLGDSVLSIHNLSNNNAALHFYPNPAHDNINIDYPLEKSANTFLKFTDLSGRIVYFEQYLNTKIDISFLSPGIYILQLQDEKMHLKPANFIKQ